VEVIITDKKKRNFARAALNVRFAEKVTDEEKRDFKCDALNVKPERL
jgi:predicted fused transcriptional regulator/phosphomethylpyrimidine kinase